MYNGMVLIFDVVIFIQVPKWKWSSFLLQLWVRELGVEERFVYQTVETTYEYLLVSKYYL